MRSPKVSAQVSEIRIKTGYDPVQKVKVKPESVKKIQEQLENSLRYRLCAQDQIQNDVNISDWCQYIWRIGHLAIT